MTLNEASDYPEEINAVYESRRNALCDGLQRIGWDIERPRGTMFAWAPIPEPYAELGSIEFAKLIVNECDVATSPGVGFGPERGRVRALRPDRERAAHPAGRPPAQARPPQARLTPALRVDHVQYAGVASACMHTYLRRHFAC